jgi:hypothetical protein
MYKVIFTNFQGTLPANLESLGALYDDALQGTGFMKIAHLAGDRAAKKLFSVGYKQSTIDFDGPDVFFSEEIIKDKLAILDAVDAAHDLQASLQNLRPTRLNLTLDEDTVDILRRIGHGDVSYGAMLCCMNVMDMKYCPVTEADRVGRCPPRALSMQLRHEDCLFQYGNGNKSLGLRRAVQLAKICGLVK